LLEAWPGSPAAATAARGLKFESENQDSAHVIAGILKDATHHPYKAREFVADGRGRVFGARVMLARQNSLSASPTPLLIQVSANNFHIRTKAIAV
jgi:hypothetical protein